MIGRVNLRLDVEDHLGHPDMALQVCRHLRQRVQEAGKETAIGLSNGVVRIGKVVAHRAIIGIDRDLDRIANVVQAAGIVGLAVGIR